MKNFLFPKFLRKASLKKWIFFLFSLCFFFLFVPILLFFYQNCAPQTPTSFYTGASRSFDVPPFAYDTKWDTLSYMSCADVPKHLIQDHFYHFKVGAYRKGSGIRFSQEFLEQIEGMKESKILSLLQDSDFLNSKVRLQISLRGFSELQDKPSYLGETLLEGEHFQNFFLPLDADDVVQRLLQLKDKERMNNFYALPLFNKNRFLTGSLYFLPKRQISPTFSGRDVTYIISGENILDFYIGKLSTRELLMTLTYSKFTYQNLKAQAVPSFEDFDKYADYIASKKKERLEKGESFLDEELEDNEDIFGPREGIDPSKVQGKGFSLQFRDGGGLLSRGGQQFRYTALDGYRVISQVTEIDLRKGEALDRVWNCRSFMVVQSTDNQEPEEEEKDEKREEEEEEEDGVTQLQRRHFSTYPLCPEEAEDPDNPDPAYQALRSVLSKEGWSINMDHGCVVEKGPHDLCYMGKRAYLRPHEVKINYFGGKCGKDMEKWDCPNYVSICYAEDSFPSL